MVLCKKGVEPSIMITGILCTKRVIFYDGLEDLSHKLEEIIQEFSNI